jgi:DNA polymerase III epsilon subunit-like protein
MQWGSIEDTEQFESNFSLIWETHKHNEKWKDDFVKKALEFCNTDFQWRVLSKKQKYHLCYQEDLVKIQGLLHNTQPFDVKNTEHRKLALGAYFGPTILSCALLHMKKNKEKIDIIRHFDEPYHYDKSRSGNDACYYQVYKPDEHYIHSNEAERIHNLSHEWIQKNGVSIKKMLEQFIYLCLDPKFKGKIKFVAHNVAADRQYLLDAIDKYISFMEYRSEIKGKALNIHDINLMKAYVEDIGSWICTYTKVRGTLQNCSLSSVYKYFTKSNMPKKHDAQMDVYACATIFCHLQGIKDQSQLIDLIGKIESTEIVCQKPMDFWRHARRRNAKQAIKADDYIDLKNWSICLKWDGFYVRLKRDAVDKDKWRMYTRSGNELHPPKSFLESLRSLEFPDGMEMEGELVFDSDQKCNPAAQNNVEKRIQKRTEDFAKLHISSLRSTKSFTSWHRLRLVLFAFPVMGQTFRESFKYGKKLIVDSKDQHAHITACGYYRLKSTKQAFDIFTTVVQMGCEGVIVRDPNAVYENRTETDKTKSKVFKMKQKIVTDNEQIIELSGEPTRKKDGTEKEEIDYKVMAFKVHDTDIACEITFKDWRDAVVGPGGIQQKLKFHEKAKWKMAWDLNEKGYRHICFATDQDVSYPVPVKAGNVNNEYDQEIIDTIEKHIFVETKPFQFIVETAYVFLDLHMQENLVDPTSNTMDIGMLRLMGKTDQEIQPQWFLHRKYAQKDSQQFVADMTQFLHHIPNDNKRLVFVVTDKHVLEKFKTYIQDILVRGIHNQGYNNLPKDTIRRLEVNDKARKQQVDVILMEEWKGKKLHKTLISWNSDCSAGLIPERINTDNENTVCALVSPELSDEKFKDMCGNQFDNCVRLQNLWNESVSEEIVLADIAKLETPPRFYTKDMTLANYYDLLNSLNLNFEVKHKALYNTLLEYDQQEKNSTGIITREDFEKAFKAARQREQSCPHDPLESLKFPYLRTDDGHRNVWHRAWRMSESFFRCNKMIVSRKPPDVFKNDPDLDLWLHPQQTVSRESSSEVEIIEDKIPEAKIPDTRPTQESVVSSVDGGKKAQTSRNPKKIVRGHDTSESEEDGGGGKRPKADNFGLTTTTSILNPRPANKKRVQEQAQSPASIKKRAPEQPRPATDNEKKDKKGPPSVEEWLETKSTPNPDSPHKDSPHEEPTANAKRWLEEQMNGKKSELKITALLQKLKMYAS